NWVFCLLARAPAVAAGLARAGRRSMSLAPVLGSMAGGMLAEIEDGSGAVTQARVFAARRSYLAAVAPAVLAIRGIASGQFREKGLVPHDRHVDADELIAYLRRLGIECSTSGPPMPCSSPRALSREFDVIAWVERTQESTQLLVGLQSALRDNRFVLAAVM